MIGRALICPPVGGSRFNCYNQRLLAVARPSSSAGWSSNRGRHNVTGAVPFDHAHQAGGENRTLAGAAARERPAQAKAKLTKVLATFAAAKGAKDDEQK